MNDITKPMSFFNENDFIYVENPMYVRDVKQILGNTTNRILANYMIWKVIDESVDYLNDEIRSKKLLVDKAASGISKIDSREKECVKKMIDKDEGLLPAMSAMYIKTYLKNEEKIKVQNMVTELHGYYKEVLQKVILI